MLVLYIELLRILFCKTYERRGNKTHPCLKSMDILRLECKLNSVKRYTAYEDNTGLDILYYKGL